MFIDKTKKIIFYIGCFGLYFLPLSLSLVQFFLYLSSLLLITMILSTKENKEIFFKIPISFIGIYLFLYIISIFRNISFKEIFTTEGKDVFLILFFLWSYYFIQSSFKNQLLKTIKIVFFIYLFIGGISLFLPFRISNLIYHLQNGFVFDGNHRSQHLILSLDFLPIHWHLNSMTYPIGIYIPVGFSGTHLSFGAQISLVSFYFLSLCFISYFKTKNIKQIMIYWLFLFLSLVILFFTQARSSLFGFFITSLVYIFLNIFLIYKIDDYKKNVINLLKIFIIILFILILLFSVLFFVSYKFNEIILQTIGLEKRHTDYQRLLLWYTAIRVLSKNPILGAGINQFKTTIFNEILMITKEKPLLWYPLFQTEIMHGHNDLIHLLVIGGLIAGFLYLLFFYCQFKNISIFSQNFYSIFTNPKIEFTENPFLIFLFLPVFLLFAGLFQCYFLDDYTMQLFWILYGISIGLLNQIKKREE
jgi:O-antigen ligase